MTEANRQYATLVAKYGEGSKQAQKFLGKNKEYLAHPNAGPRADARYNEAIELNKKYDELVSKYGKGSKELYEFKRDILGIHRKRKLGKLEVGLAIIWLIGAIFFLSSSITGNAIGNMTNSTTNIIGGILFVIGLVAGLVYFKAR